MSKAELCISVWSLKKKHTHTICWSVLDDRLSQLVPQIANHGAPSSLAGDWLRSHRLTHTRRPLQNLVSVLDGDADHTPGLTDTGAT